MRTQSTRTDDRFHMHCVMPARFHKRIRILASHKDSTISDLVHAILEPEVDRQLKEIERGLAHPK